MCWAPAGVEVGSAGCLGVTMLNGLILLALSTAVMVWVALTVIGLQISVCDMCDPRGQVERFGSETPMYITLRY